jgi:hypothetical protein
MAMERTRGIGKALARDFLTGLMARYAEEFPEKFVAEKKGRAQKRKLRPFSTVPPYHSIPSKMLV